MKKIGMFLVKTAGGWAFWTAVGAVVVATCKPARDRMISSTEVSIQTLQENCK